jgi:hypothetical protein
MTARAPLCLTSSISHYNIKLEIMQGKVPEMVEKHRLTELANMWPQEDGMVERLLKKWPELGEEVTALPPGDSHKDRLAPGFCSTLVGRGS